MLTVDEYEDAHVLRCQGWSISAIARHLARDRKTVRSYLDGERVPGVRRPPKEEFERFLPYCRLRLADAPHLQGTALFDEVVELGYTGAYSTFTRALRKHQVRPVCALCCGNARGADATAQVPARGEVRFSWLRLPDPPMRWGCGSHAHLLVGSLTHTGRWRAVLTENEEFPQFVEAIDRVLRRLGGTTETWRFDQSLAVSSPTTGKVTRAFAQVADFYGVRIVFSPWQGTRDLVEGEGLRSISRKWWRRVHDDTDMQAVQSSLDELAARMDDRGQRTPVAGAVCGVPTAAQGLLDLPSTPFPFQVCVMRTVRPEGMVPFRGNVYAVPSDLCGAAVEVRWHLGEPCLSIATAGGAVIARHAVAPQGAGRTVTGHSSPITLDRTPRAVPTKGLPCQGSTNRPPSPAALAEAQALRGCASAQEQPQRITPTQIIDTRATNALTGARGPGVAEARGFPCDHTHKHRRPLADPAGDVIDGTADPERFDGGFA